MKEHCLLDSQYITLSAYYIPAFFRLTPKPVVPVVGGGTTGEEFEPWRLRFGRFSGPVVGGAGGTTACTILPCGTPTFATANNNIKLILCTLHGTRHTRRRLTLAPWLLHPFHLLQAFMEHQSHILKSSDSVTH